MSPLAITLDQVLAITYTSGHTWAPDGRSIAFIHDDGGRFSLRVVDVERGAIAEVSEGDDPVTQFDWAPDGRLAYVQGGRIVLASRPSPGAPGEWSRRLLYEGSGPAAFAAWSPAGQHLAYVAGGRLWALDLGGPGLRELQVPGRVAALGHDPALAWAPDGSAVAATFEDQGWWDLAVVDADGTLLWRSRTENLEQAFVWVQRDQLIFARPSVDHVAREWHVLDLPAGTTRMLHREDEPEGLGAIFRPQPYPDGRHVVLVLRHEGWWHLYLLDTQTGHLQTMTGGIGEDVGHALDHPCVSPDGREIVFSTNRLNLGMRHLFSVDVATAALRPVVSAPGTSVEPAWSPDGRRIAFKHSTTHHAPEIWVVGRDGDHLRRLVGSMPEGIAYDRLAVPEPMRTPGAGGWDIPGYLLAPRTLEPGRRYPALVYIHGGGMRQMREGFPPLETYAFFYAVSLWLAELGVVSYLVNYRGGIGYGKTFEQGNARGLAVLECEDCVRAGEYVKTLAFVDPDRVGVWGISYGGWLTLAALCRSPQTFALGINIAGIWDFDRWMAWAKTSYRPAYDYFLGRAGGGRDQHPEVWDGASPRLLVERVQAPLVSFHGSKDAAVPIEQLDLIIRDCVAHQKAFEAHYYPDETHLFTHRATWRDALQKIAAAIARYLGRGQKPPSAADLLLERAGDPGGGSS
ncbi:MAG: prolyl oligopeptidase family serine peptidase [Armatimonadota bacterium]|nr:prolyl oligopeptidase family serine peptidase [Armatimonadota bacterium]